MISYLGKKLKKNVVDPNEDNLASAYEKLQKITEGLNKSYEGAVKAKTFYDITKENKDGCNYWYHVVIGELNKELNQKKIL